MAKACPHRARQATKKQDVAENVLQIIDVPSPGSPFERSLTSNQHNQPNNDVPIDDQPDDDITTTTTTGILRLDTDV